MNNLQRAIDSDYGTLILPPIVPDTLEAKKHPGGRPRSPEPIVRRKEYMKSGKLYFCYSISFNGRKYSSSSVHQSTVEAWLARKLKEITN